MFVFLEIKMFYWQYNFERFVAHQQIFKLVSRNVESDSEIKLNYNKYFLSVYLIQNNSKFTIIYKLYIT